MSHHSASTKEKRSLSGALKKVEDMDSWCNIGASKPPLRGIGNLQFAGAQHDLFSMEMVHTVGFGSGCHFVWELTVLLFLQ